MSFVGYTTKKVAFKFQAALKLLRQLASTFNS